MPTPPLSDAALIEAVTALKLANGIKDKAAQSLNNMNPKTFRHRLKIAAERGFMLDHAPAMPGFQISKVTTDSEGRVTSVQQKPEAGGLFAVPDGHRVKGVSALLDPEGRELAKWVKTREGELDPLEVAEALKKAFAGYVPAAPAVAPPVDTREDLLTLLPCGDWHLGMFAWGKEVGENWDLKIAQDVIGRSVSDTVARSPASGVAIVLSGGDLLHADNKENQTSRSGHVLDVDGRYQKVVDAATKLMVQTVDAALARHAHVIVRVLQGNHDEHSAVAVAYFLLAWYRNEPRVTVDVDPSLFFRHRFGSVLLGATHGHTVKIKDMPMLMAHRWAEDWGATKFRYVHGFHLHHTAKFATEGNGCICEIHRAPVPQDAWHYGAGFLSGRSMQAITYHREFGEIGRVQTAILDGGAE